MNTFCHSTIAARIETAAAAIILFLTTLTSCGRSSSPEPLDQWNDGTSTLHTADPVIAEGRKLFNDKEYQNFRLTGEALTQPGSEAGLLFHTDGESGYEVIFRNGDIDGTRKSGSLASVRNLYRSLAKDGEWFDFEITVRGQNIIVCINGTEVVCYTEPGHPYRTEEHARQLLSQGSIALQGIHGEVSFRNLAIERLAKEARNEADTLAPVDERTDEIIRLQQHDFPVIDYHVHLKGGLTKEMAHAMSMNYGINYGVAPNAGEGGVGRMLADDKEVYDYFNEVKGMPFLCGVQGEGRKWTATFSQEALGIFDYLFTDAMTIIDHKGRNSRIYRAEEALFDDITLEQYMDHLVDQTVLILTNEPADIMPTLPSCPILWRMITTSTGRTDALNAYWMYCNNMESLWKSMHATGFPVSRLSVAPKHVESNSHSVQTMSMPTSDDWNTAPKPSSNAASQPTIYGSRR